MSFRYCRWGGGRGHRPRRRAGALLLALAVLCLIPTMAQAAGEPQIGAIWMTEVSAGSASFHGEVDPQGESTTYRFEYATDQAFEENGFNGAAKAPAGGSAELNE